MELLRKNDCKVLYPFPLIQDGQIQTQAMKEGHFSNDDLIQAMKKNDIDDIKDVFLCLYTKNGFSFIKKNSLNA